VSEQLAGFFSLANVLAHEGREAEARPLIEDLLRRAEDAGSLWDLTKGWTALGALELALGNDLAAVGPLARAEEGRDRLGDDMNRRHDGDLVEALLATGRVTEAEAAADQIERRAHRFPRRSRWAVAARGRGLVLAAAGDLDGAIAALDVALHEHDAAPLPFDRARTELVLGRVRRKRRERSLARDAFEAALATFDRLGARSWAERTRGEIDRLGLRRGSTFELTASERKLAELAAGGMTNREAAAAMFISPKTVEVMLARVYQKLGIRSRAELGAVMAGAGRAGLETSGGTAPTPGAPRQP